MGDLFDTKGFANQLSERICNSKCSINIITAYLSVPGVLWLLERRPENVDVQLCVRLSLRDVFDGATNLAAIKQAIDAGFVVSMHRSLHAKIYIFDRSEIMLGSANLTGNGLCIHGTGNLEIGTQLIADHSSLELIDRVFADAVSLSLDDIERLEAFVASLKVQDKSNLPSDWPDGLIGNSSGLWVADFLWEPTTGNSVSCQHDKELLGIGEGNVLNIGYRFCQLHCLEWLKAQLSTQSDNMMYFGQLSKQMHDDLSDDPAPYRQGVKALLQNLLSFCIEYPECGVIVDRPNHSQRVRLQ